MDRSSADASAGDRCFVRWLSLTLVIVSSIGALIVLIDPVVTFATDGGTTVKIGGEGFSDQIKGAVVALILVGGFSAVIAYWLGASSQGVKAQESVTTIAQQAAPAQAAAVAAARAEPGPAPQSGPTSADTVNIEARTAVVNQEPQK